MKSLIKHTFNSSSQNKKMGWNNLNDFVEDLKKISHSQRRNHDGINVSIVPKNMENLLDQQNKPPPPVPMIDPRRQMQDIFERQDARLPQYQEAEVSRMIDKIHPNFFDSSIKEDEIRPFPTSSNRLLFHENVKEIEAIEKPEVETIQVEEIQTREKAEVETIQVKDNKAPTIAKPKKLKKCRNAFLLSIQKKETLEANSYRNALHNNDINSKSHHKNNNSGFHIKAEDFPAF